MKRVLFPILLGIVGVAVLVALGVWQLQRLSWKEALLAEIEARIADAPVALPEAPRPETDAYRAVALEGTVVGPAIAVFGTWREAGAGYRLIAPVGTGDRRVLVDFGVAAGPDTPLPEARLAITGNLTFPEETEPDPAAAIWTNLDLSAMADRLGAEPFLVVARDITGADPATRRVPVGTEGIPNNHLGYAIQWFGLAAVWAGMTAFLLWRIHGRTDEKEA